MVETGIPVSVWADEGAAVIATAVEVLRKRNSKSAESGDSSRQMSG